MADFEIYFRDLTPEAQKEFLMFQGIATAKAGNYDVFPIATIEGSEPELTELKLYCPLVVCADPNSELGYEYGSNGEDEPHEITNKAARYFEAQVSEAIDRSMSEETPRGLMDYFDGSDAVNDKVYSMHPAVEVKGGELVGVCVLRIKEPLTPSELNEIREYATGQFSDGWGEGFEQHASVEPFYHNGDYAVYVIRLCRKPRFPAKQGERERNISTHGTGNYAFGIWRCTDARANRERGYRRLFA